jgi:excinuclease ABC subunit A
MRVVAACDWVIDIGPGAGDLGGKVVAAGPPQVVADSKQSRTAPYLRPYLSGHGAGSRAPAVTRGSIQKRAA